VHYVSGVTIYHTDEEQEIQITSTLFPRYSLFES